MSAARRRKSQPSKRPHNPFPWRLFLWLLGAAAGASVWRWEGGRAVWAPGVELLGGGIGLVGVGVAVGRGLRPGKWGFGLGLVAAGALLSRLGTLVSPYFLFLSLAGGLGGLFWPAGETLLLLLPLVGWAGPALGGGPLLSGLLSGVAMALLAGRVRQNRDLMVAGLAAGLAGGLGAAVFWPLATPLGVAAAFVAGPAAALLSFAVLPLVERTTDHTSHLSLAELLSPSHPLLERLRAEAPGTYYHSRDVAALAEAATRAVGGDPLLAAVGGLYHDIGKLLHPHLFVENQNGANPHEALAPSMSKVVLSAHVREGVKLGRRYGLKGDVLRFVATHHGTTVMRSFSKGLPEDEFRYDFPLPDTKETAIVMLADAAEASARGAEREDVAELVHQAIEERHRDGQLDRSPLTLADLAKVHRAFVEALQGITHRRAKDYPRPG